MSTIARLSEAYEQRLVFIGGIAVFLHVARAFGTSARPLSEGLIEFSHDGDFFVSFEDLDALRHTENVTRTPHLRKYHFTLNDVDFDVYAERGHSLRVPFEEAALASTVIEGVRVASLEHLLILKIDAWRGRRNRPKGSKDARDVVRIAHLIARRGGPRIELLRCCLMEQDARDLAEIARGPEVAALVGGNLHFATKLRRDSLAVSGKLACMSSARDPRRRRARSTI